ncbi:MAG: phosphate-starvation-inducible PsiE family protein [Cyanobacteria bacterium P01_A01_bin.45]
MQKNIFTPLIELFKRDRVIRNLEFFQDIIVISLCIGLLTVMLLRLGDMFISLMHLHKSQQIISDILFILIMVELFRLLIIYLQEHRISLGAAVEVAIVSALREVILRGILDIELTQIIGVCGFLLVLAGLLVAGVLVSKFLIPTNHKETNHKNAQIEDLIL